MSVSCAEYSEWTRRSFLVAGAAALFGTRSLAQLVMNGNDELHALVVIFLRGGMDGLSAIVPHQEDAYYRMRPTLAVPKRSVHDLDGFFGLHPSLRALYGAFAEGDLAPIHAVGSLDQSHSHFEAMNAMERGAATATQGEANGWLARYLNLTRNANQSPLRAISISPVLPDSLRGGIGAISLESLEEYRLASQNSDKLEQSLVELYEHGNDTFSIAGRNTLHVLDALRGTNMRMYRPEHDALYPDTDFSQSLKQIAFLIKNGFGVEIACLEKGGWDTHIAQGSTEGWLANQFQDLGDSIAAFRKDTQNHSRRITVLVMTEFGRRAYENSGLGTDHGSASVMFAIGGGIRGGKVLGHWPGLRSAELEGPGDLEVTTDYRSVLVEVLRHRLNFTAANALFPDLSPVPVGVA